MLCVWEFSTVNMIHDDGPVGQGQPDASGAEVPRRREVLCRSYTRVRPRRYVYMQTAV